MLNRNGFDETPDDLDLVYVYTDPTKAMTAHIPYAKVSSVVTMKGNAQVFLVGDRIPIEIYGHTFAQEFKRRWLAYLKRNEPSSVNNLSAIVCGSVHSHASSPCCLRLGHDSSQHADNEGGQWLDGGNQAYCITRDTD